MNYNTIPEILKQLPNWVARVGKIPVDPNTGYGAKTDVPQTWGTFEQAVRCVGQPDTKDNICDGIGIELNAPYCGIDIDHCRDAETGELTREALDIIRTMDSYTEISPSGTGVHILYMNDGSVYPERHKNKMIDKKQRLEMYQTGHYLTVTGNVLDGYDTYAERAAAADQVYKTYMEDSEPKQTATQSRKKPLFLPSYSTTLSDNEIIEKAAAAKNGAKFSALWNGDISAYNNDDSRADLALCNKLAFWSCCDASAIDRLFRQSALMRPKWDEKRGAQTYGQLTINKAIEKCDNVYTPKAECSWVCRKLNDVCRDIKSKGDITDICENETPIPGITKAETVTHKLEGNTVTTQLFEPQTDKTADNKNTDSSPAWVYQYGQQQKIYEERYITEFVDNHGFKCIKDQLFSVDGVFPDGKAKQLIIKDILPYVKTNHGDKAEKLLRGIKTLCYSEPPEPQLDTLHFKNGTLSKDSNGLFTVWSSKKEFCINRINTNYNPNASEPKRFLKYLYDLYHSDDCITIQQYCGYCLLPTTILQQALIIIGDGGEGKSVLGAILNNIFGEANCCNDSISVLEEKFGVANVENTLVFIDDDLSENALSNARNFKTLVTNTTNILAPKKFIQKNEFKSFVRFLCFGNFTLHALHDTSGGFTRRQLVLEVKPIDPNRIDNPFLHQEIIENESEGVLLWLINGLNTLIQNKFKIYISERTQEVSDRIKQEADSVSLFLNECCDIKYGPDLSIRSADLVSLYNRFCVDNVLIAMNNNTFIAAVKGKGKKWGIKYNVNVVYKGKRARGFTGIGMAIYMP